MKRELLWMLTALFAGGCASSHPVPPKGQPENTLREIRLAQQGRDLDALRKLGGRTDLDAKGRAELALATYWSSDVLTAEPLLASACHDARLAADSDERTHACAALAWVDLSRGKPLNSVVSYGAAPLLPKQKLLIAMVAVNGHPPEPFIVDTGAPTTVISQTYADRVGIPYRRDVAYRSSDSGGASVSLFPTVLQSVKWGDLEVETVPAHVLTLPPNFKIGGILSPQDTLRGTAFELDGPRGQLRITPGIQTVQDWSRTLPTPPHQTPLLWEGGNLLVRATTQDLPSMPFLLDSGAGGNGECQQALIQAGRAEVLQTGKKAQTSAAAGDHPVWVGLSGTLRVGDEPPQPTPFFAAACPTPAPDAPPRSGTVGAPWFQSHRVFFPSDRRTLVFTSTP